MSFRYTRAGQRIEPAIPESLKRRAAQIGRKRAPQQLAIHLEVRARHERVDEVLVDLHEHDQVLRQVVDAGHERVLVVLGEVLVHRVAQVRPRHDAIEQLRDHEAVIDQRLLRQERRHVRGRLVRR